MKVKKTISLEKSVPSAANVKVKEEKAEVVIDMQKKFTPALLQLTKNTTQEIGLDYQMINWDDIEGETERLKVKKNKLIVNDNFKALTVKTNITVNNLVKITMKIFKERNGIKGELKTITKSGIRAFEDIQIISVKKGDIISFEFAYDTLVKVNSDNQTYIDIIGF